MAAILYGVLSFLLQQVLIKFVVYTILLLFIGEAVSWLTQYMTGGDGGIGAAFTALSSVGTFTVAGQTFDPVASFWYLFNLFQIGPGLALILAAYATRFLIRRLPIIG